MANATTACRPSTAPPVNGEHLALKCVAPQDHLPFAMLATCDRMPGQAEGPKASGRDLIEDIGAIVGSQSSQLPRMYSPIIRMVWTCRWVLLSTLGFRPHPGQCKQVRTLEPCSQGDPAVLRLPENYKLTAGASQRVAATSSASAAVEAEHADFAKAAAGIK